MKYFPEKSKKYIIFILMSALPLMGFAVNSKPDKTYDEYAVKAHFLRLCLSYVDYPETAFSGPKASFVIGIIGRGPYSKTLNDIEKKTVNKRKIVIKRFKQDAPVEELKKCHMLFISSSHFRTKRFSRSKIKKLIDSLRDFSVLTISDVKEFGHLGGMINLVIIDEKLRFEVNITAVNQTGIKIRSKLLKLATKIIGANHAKQLTRQ